MTSDLDEGPIIEQDVESIVLSRAVRWHTESRVLRNGSRTVAFQ